MDHNEISKVTHSQQLHAQPQEQQQIAFGLSQPSSSLSGSFMNKDTGAYDLGELDQALFLYLDGHDHPSVQEQKQTLNIFPSQPMHVDPSSKGGLGIASPATFVFKRPSDRSNQSTRSQVPIAPDPGKDVKAADKLKRREGSRKGATSSAEQESSKMLEPKTLRRLAQNREAARKSRLRKKAYIQQLESSRIKLAQLEQELQRARSQGVLIGGTVGEQITPSGRISADAALFDAEYARWLEEHHRLMWDLRAALQEQLPQNELEMFVDSCFSHYNEIIILKSMLIKTDVFHLVTGMWKTPAERCFMWLGGFRPSDIIKLFVLLFRPNPSSKWKNRQHKSKQKDQEGTTMRIIKQFLLKKLREYQIIVSQIEPLTEQQMMELYSLKTSTDEAENSLSQGLEGLQRSLSDTIASNELSCPSNVANYMGQMAMAVNKLSTLEGLVRQADNLRQQTLHRLHQMLSTRQSARCFLAVGEYFHRLRALSSLWLARPRQE